MGNCVLLFPCVGGNVSKASTGRPSPTWLITTQSPNVWGTKSPTSRPPPPPPPPNVSAITTWTPVKLTTSTAATTVVTSVIPSKQPPLVPVEPIEALFVPPVVEKKTPTQNNEQTYQSSSEEQTTLPYSATVFPNKPTGNYHPPQILPFLTSQIINPPTTLLN